MSDSEFQRSVKECFIRCFSLPTRDEQEQYLLELADSSAELADAVRELLGFLETKSGAIHPSHADTPSQREAQHQTSQPELGPFHPTQQGVLGRYRLVEKIGEGGMGAVFKAEQTTPIQRFVAVKIIKAGLDTTQLVRRFEMERQTLALMDHSNIAKVFDAGATESGRPYFVMELVDGVPLTKFCQEQRSSIDDRLQLFVEVCAGVKHAHQRGVIHRDLKPSNVLVTLQEGKPGIKIIDFGIAKVLASEEQGATLFTSQSQLVGTPLYMSPEQAEPGKRDIDTRSDVYSLGVILYELLTDTTPFSRETLREAGYDEIRRIIKEVDPQKPSQRITTNGGVTSTLGGHKASDVRRVKLKLKSELDWIVMRAIEKERSRRYDSVNAFADDVQSYLSDQPVLACPPSVLYRCSKFYRKNRLSVFASILVLSSLIAGLTSTAIQWIRAERLASTQSELRMSAEALAKKERAARELADARLYASKIRRADSEWASGNHIIARRVLAETNESLRGWEFGMLQQLFSAKSIAVGKGHEGEVQSLVYDRENQIITGGQDGTIRIWDADSLALTRTINAHASGINAILLSPEANEVISASNDKTIRFWDIARGTLKRELEQPTEINAISISCDDRLLATGGDDGIIRVFKIDSFEEVNQLLPQSGEILSLKFDYENPTLLASGTNQNSLSFWAVNGAETNLGTALNLFQMALGAPKNQIFDFAGHGFEVTGIEFSPFEFPDTDPIALTSGDDGWIKGWDYQGGYQFLFYNGHTQPVHDISLSPDEIHFASASADGTARLWKYDEGLEIAQFREHESDVNCVAFSPDGKFLASGGADGKIILWSTFQTANKEYWQDQVFDDDILEVAFSPDGSRVLTVGSPRLLIWDASSREQIAGVLLKETELVDVSWNKAGDGVLLVYKGGLVDLVNASTGEIQDTYELGFDAQQIELSESGQQYFSLDRKVLSWDQVTRTELGEWETNGSPVRLAAVGDNIACVTDAGAVTIKNSSTTKTVADFQVRANELAWIALSEDLNEVAVLTDNGQLSVWDIPKSMFRLQIELGEGRLSAAKIDLMTERVFTGNEDGLVRAWDLKSGAFLISLPAFEDRDEPISAIDFSSESSRVLCAGTLGDVYMWNVPSSAADDDSE